MTDGVVAQPASANPASPAAEVAATPQTIERPDRKTAIAAAMETGQRVRITSLTSETSEYFALPSGAVEASVAAGPVRIRRDNGWTPVNLDLQKAADGSVVPVAHPIGLKLSGSRTGSGTLASLGDGAGVVNMEWPSALPEPQLDRNKAVYREVSPGIDVVVEATRSGFEQFVVVKTPAALPAVKSLSFPLTGAGVGSVTEDSTGSLEVKNRQGKAMGTVPTPLMWDAQLAPNGETPARTAEIDVAVRKPAKASGARTLARSESEPTGSVTLQLNPDQAWLTDPKTRYPITIDPQISKLTTYFDTTVSEGTSADQGGADYLRLGVTTSASPKKSRTFVKWNTSALRGMEITAARTYFYNWYSTTCSKTSWEIWTTEPADADTRWANQPRWLTKEATSTETKGFNSSCNDGWVSIDSRTFFQRAAAADSSWGHMGVRATNEADTKQWKEFRSRNADDTAQVPYSTITYESGEGEFAVMAGAGITEGMEMTGAEMENKLVAMGYTRAQIDQALVPAADASASSALEPPAAEGTPEPFDPNDDTAFNEAWTASGGEGSPPPVEPDAPASGRGAAEYAPVPVEPPTVGIMSAYTRVAAWREVRGVHTVIREGVANFDSNGNITGHNLEKIDRKHNLTVRVLQITTKRPQYWYHVNGKKYTYESYPVHKMRCTWSGIIRRCKSLKKTAIVASVDFRLLRDGYSFGFPTAYCNTYAGRCPNWVKNAIG